MCKKQFAEELDHIVPLFKGGTNDEDNLQGLCKKCHAEKTKRDLNLRTGVGVDGWPIET
jgi:5-methylcytosine-specific restriction protein A